MYLVIDEELDASVEARKEQHRVLMTLALWVAHPPLLVDCDSFAGTMRTLVSEPLFPSSCVDVEISVRIIWMLARNFHIDVDAEPCAGRHIEVSISRIDCGYPRD